VDVGPLEPYVAALNDPQLPLVPMEWTSRSSAHIASQLQPDQVLSVQISYHPGWRALVNGSERPITSDALGMMVVHPHCSGDCAVELIYDGGREMRWARPAQILSLVVCVVLVFGGRLRLTGIDSTT
jgi:hypothetical protein